MPARTNAFQEMVALLTAVMREDESMMVTPSAMLPDVITGDLREVDICVETQVAGHKVLVGIECRDWGRPQAVTWVEEMHTRHEALPVNVTVLVSSSGFTKGASTKAAHYGMRTITPGDVTPGFVGSVVNNLDKVTTKRVHFRVHSVFLHVKLADGHLPWVEAFVDSPLYTHDGTEIATVGVIVKEMVSGNPKQRAHLQTATDKDKFMRILTDGPTDNNGQPLFIVPATKSGEELPPAPVVGMRIGGPVELDLIEVPLTHGDYDGRPYSTGSAPFEDMRVSVAATEGEDGSVRWAGSATKSGGVQEFF
jgi:hypothetical protein